MQLKEVKDISEELRAGRAKAALRVVSKHNNFSIFRLGGDFFPWDPPLDDLLSRQKSSSSEVLHVLLVNSRANPVTGAGGPRHVGK